MNTCTSFDALDYSFYDPRFGTFRTMTAQQLDNQFNKEETDDMGSAMDEYKPWNTHEFINGDYCVDEADAEDMELSVWEKQTEVKGMSPDQPIVTNEKGGKQSASPYAFHLVPAKALLECAEVLQYGANRYGAYNWKNIDIEDHVNHAAAHIYAHLAGDTTDQHLSHAIVRLMFALELNIEAE